jgi:Tfp pilus tip-associated adhesin PilY1
MIVLALSWAGFIGLFVACLFPANHRDRRSIVGRIIHHEPGWARPRRTWATAAIPTQDERIRQFIARKLGTINSRIR